MPWRLMLALLFMTAAVGPAPAHNLQSLAALAPHLAHA